MVKKTDMAVLPTNDVAERLQEVVLAVTGSEGLNGFKKAYLMASGIEQLRELLTAEFMAPIMKLQGSKLGFRTDKDRNKDGTKGPGYSMDIVRDCVIEATLNGYEITGNQFNIIASNMYPTKEGCGSKLNKFKGLKYQIICSLPKINNDKTSAAIDVTIKWSLNGESDEEVVPIPIKMDAYTSVDGLAGKATRKARAWLLSRITGTEVTDGDIEDQGSARVVDSKLSKKSDKEIEDERTKLLIDGAGTIEELDFYLNTVSEEVRPHFDAKREKLLNAKK